MDLKALVLNFDEKIEPAMAASLARSLQCTAMLFANNQVFVHLNDRRTTYQAAGNCLLVLPFANILPSTSTEARLNGI